jgi:hypothetical protein
MKIVSELSYNRRENGLVYCPNSFFLQGEDSYGFIEEY